MNISEYKFISILLLFIGLTFACLGNTTVLASCKPQAISSKRIVSTKPLKRPALNRPFKDPKFGSCLQRVTDHRKLHDKVTGANYSQLQAWNADQSMILLVSNQIIDAKTFKLLHVIDSVSARNPRWSPTDPTLLYFTGGQASGKVNGRKCRSNDARLMTYRLKLGSKIKGSHEFVHCFPEYKSFAKDPSWEDLSSDGRYIALVGERKKDSRYELFAFDVIDKIKYKALVLPVHKKWGPLKPDWAAVTPSGKYVLAQWGKGRDRFDGLEAYDLKTMRYAGKVSTSSGHGDIAIDKKGQEYFVQTNASNAYLLGDRHYLIKARIPNGIYFNKTGYVDESRTLKSGATVPLLTLDWHHDIHVSCRNHKRPGFCVVTTGWGRKNGLQPLEREIFTLDLRSRVKRPRVIRLAHHRSRPEVVKKNCSDISTYWADPHATISPDGRRILFRSTWGKHCYVESYQINLPIR